MRWLGIAARTSHIGAAALLFGGLLLATPFVRLTPWHHLTIATGGFLLLLEWRHDPRRPHRGKGLLALLHLGLCLLIHWTPALTAPLLWCRCTTARATPSATRCWSVCKACARKPSRRCS